jgi:hypothetical protein
MRRWITTGRICFLIQLVYFLLFTCWFVPISLQVLASWPLFLRTLSLRLLIVVPFLVATRGVMAAGQVDAIRISPPPESAADGLAFGSEESTELPATGPTTQRKPMRMGIFGVGLCIFLADLVRGLHAAMRLPVTPNVVFGCCWALVESLLLGVFTLVFLTALVERRVQITRRSVMVAAAVVVLVGTYWVFPEQAAEWGIRFLCFGTMIFFFMPKPGQMSASIPELLHVVPRPHMEQGNAKQAS